jgi:hypothetical protein
MSELGKYRRRRRNVLELAQITWGGRHSSPQCGYTTAVNHVTVLFSELGVDLL